MILVDQLVDVDVSVLEPSSSSVISDCHKGEQLPSERLTLLDLSPKRASRDNTGAGIESVAASRGGSNLTEKNLHVNGCLRMRSPPAEAVLWG